MTDLTIGETIDELHSSLREYIEATYHVSHPTLVAQRRRLLDEIGVIRQRPYLESTPRHKPGPSFGEMGLDPVITEIFDQLSSPVDGQPRLLHDPPYQH